MKTLLAEALFASEVPTGERLSPAQTSDAVERALDFHEGVGGCAVALAGAYGECPETAVARMRWANEMVDASLRGSLCETYG
ncbi:hypothetical protein GCM10023170_021930 [Phytohabitans houttuyneae]|uniref:Uncharacterized protein n=1 Tax=Phytohabitans houttuyneae TaxID=1076126 RepID=A0A6V8K3P4_9ACTN|nr:hypothetical protein Phou_005970 [Phytohabitans houttuyneae]